ncbi:MAG TPA: aldolase/citrate lyase family protein [Candidatus Methylomirabilis sp.]
MRPNQVKRALQEGQVQIGTWVTTLRSPQLLQILRSAGFDFIYIDMEHSDFSIETVGDLCSAALAHGLIPIVRPPAKDAHLLTRPLEVGAMGLLLPHVDTAQEARDAVCAVKFPPLGKRGFNVRTVHTAFLAADPKKYARAANEETLLIVQIESRHGVRNLDAILAVDGVDGAVIGRGDLSADLGVMGEWDHPEVIRGVETMIRACRRRKKIPGLLVPDVRSAEYWIGKGIRLVPYSNEVTLLMAAAAAGIGAIRACASEPRPKTRASRRKQTNVRT